MASSDSQHDLGAFSNKIDAAFSIWTNGCNSDASCIKDQSSSKFATFKDMHYEYYAELCKGGKKFKSEECVASDFPFHRLFYKSKLLEDEKLYDALLYSKIYDDESEFNANRHKYAGELVWVPHFNDLMLVSENQIIYHVDRFTLVNEFRQEAQKIWALLKDKVKNNLIGAFSRPECIGDWNQYVSNLLFSYNAAVFSNSLSASSQPMTDEMGKLMLDELDSLNLDPRIKQQFAFDLKALPDQDVHYWRDRLDCLRLCSNPAAVSSPEFLELQRLSQSVENYGKIIESNATALASIAQQLKNQETKQPL